MANNKLATVSITVDSETWTATWIQPQYGSSSMRIGFWSETHEDRYGQRGGGPMYGVNNSEEALAYLYKQALSKLE